jgi:beta-phosphoglucomutase-like phosphatase (HAD superfamily)
MILVCQDLVTMETRTAVQPAQETTPFGGWTPDAVVFDCDGVLLNTEQFCLGSKLRVLERHGVRIDDDLIARIKGRNYAVVGPILAEAMGDANLAEACTRDAYDMQLEMYRSDEVRALPGALAMVRKFAAVMPVAVASSSPLIAVRGALARTGFLDYIRPEHVLCPESGDGFTPKPDPAVYREAMRRIGAMPASTLAVEDSGSGLQAARAAGMHVLGVFAQQDGKLTSLAGHWVRSLDDVKLIRWIDCVVSGKTMEA